MLEQTLLLLVAIAVGFLVGLTGVGGGAIMTPTLIIFFGFNPITAVATDLIFAAFTKAVSGFVHNRSGGVDWPVLRRLWLGSLPGVIFGLFLVVSFLGENLAFLSLLLAVILTATAVSMLISSSSSSGLRKPTLRTTVGGFIVGFSVATTSVGAGALGMALLRTLLGDKNPQRLVGTDIVHAIPVAVLAGISYGFAGFIDWSLLSLLLTGSIPGVVLGSLMVGRVNSTAMRKILGVVLLAAAAGILLKGLALG